MTTSRARRRHDRWRMVQRAARIFRTWASVPSGHAAQRFADNMRICSCAVCSGRKRALNGPTLRERRFV